VGDGSANSGVENQLRIARCSPKWFREIPAPSNRLSESVSSGARKSAGFDGIPRAGFNAANLAKRSMIPPLCS